MKHVVSKAKKCVTKVREYVNAKKLLVAAYVVSVMSDLSMKLAYATATPVPSGGGSSTTAEQKWDNVMNFILPWITRLGGVVILIGAVEFGLAFKNDDAEGKTKGIRTVIAGCIVFAVGLSADIFLA